MMKKLRVFTGLLTACLLLLASSAKAQQSSSEDFDAKYATTLLQPGTIAPDFTLKTPDGENFSLSELKGSYVVLDFWASWCPDCRKDAPEVVRLFNQYKDKGIRFVGISFDVDTTNWKAAIQKYGMDYTHVSELKKMRESAIAKTYGINWIPSMILIAPDGKIVLSTVMVEKMAKTLATVKP